MSFAAQLAAADRAVLQHLGEDGLIRYAPSVGAAVEVRGIFDAAYLKQDAGQAGVMSSQPAVFLMLADLPSDPETELQRGVVVTVQGTAYRVAEARKDGMGGVVLLLHEA